MLEVFDLRWHLKPKQTLYILLLKQLFLTNLDMRHFEQEEPAVMIEQGHALDVRTFFSLVFVLFVFGFQIPFFTHVILKHLHNAKQ